MITPVDQRVRHRRTFFVDPSRRFDPRGFEVAPIDDDETPRAFIAAHHYAKSYVPALRRFGLYAPGGQLVGVAVFSVPTNDLALLPLPGSPRESCDLGRFVMLDSVGFNGETWFLRPCLEAMRREGWIGIISFSDPEPRTTASGSLVFKGHVGQIYQASSAIYLGRGTPRTQYLMPDGTAFNDRAAQKIRAGERGWVAAAEELVAYGAPPPPKRGDLTRWLHTALKKVGRRRRHHGNHKYVFPLCRAARREVRRAVGDTRPYPRFQPELLARLA